MPPSSTWNDMFTTTVYERAKEVSDSYSNHVALLSRLRKKGKKKTFSGGLSLVKPTAYQKNQSFRRYRDWDFLNPTPSPHLTAFEFPIQQAALAVLISGREMLLNSGPNQVIDLLDSRMENAETTLFDELDEDVHSDGTEDGGKQINGVAALIPDDPTTGSVGGIPRSSNTFARSKVFSGLTDGGAAITAANILDYTTRLLSQCMRKKKSPDFAECDNNHWALYHQALVAMQRVLMKGDEDLVAAGFKVLHYDGVDIVNGGGIRGPAQANRTRFYNTDHLFFESHEDRDMVPLDPDRYSTNQDGMVRYLGWAGNLTTDWLEGHGILKP